MCLLSFTKIKLPGYSPKFNRWWIIVIAIISFLEVNNCISEYTHTETTLARDFPPITQTSTVLSDRGRPVGRQHSHFSSQLSVIFIHTDLFLHHIELCLLILMRNVMQDYTLSNISSKLFLVNSQGGKNEVIDSNVCTNNCRSIKGSRFHI